MITVSAEVEHEIGDVAAKGRVRELASALAGAKVGQLAPTWPPAPRHDGTGARCQVVAPIALKILAALI